MLIQDFGCLHKRGYRCKLKSENKNPIDFYCIVEAPRQNEEQNAFNVYMKEMLYNPRGKRCEFYVF